MKRGLRAGAAACAPCSTVPGDRRSEADVTDRRGRVRFEIVGQLWGALEVEEPARVRDIGRGGALLETQHPLPVDSLQRIRLTIDQESHIVQALVRRLTPAESGSGVRYLVGVEFVDSPDALLESIDRALSTADSETMGGVA
jgi:hypothetical protein